MSVPQVQGWLAWPGVFDVARAVVPGVSTVADPGLAPPSFFRSACLPVDALAARLARTLVGELLESWGMPGLVADARVCASELAGNTVRHARWDEADGGARRLVVSLRLAGPAHERFVWLWVRDGDPTLPVIRPAVDLDALDLGELAHVERLAESGAGLRLVGELCEELGWRRVSGGKVVWCRFAAG